MKEPSITERIEACASRLEKPLVRSIGAVGMRVTCMAAAVLIGDMIGAARRTGRMTSREVCNLLAAIERNAWRTPPKPPASAPRVPTPPRLMVWRRAAVVLLSCVMLFG
jgi:hypothetical protein